MRVVTFCDLETQTEYRLITKNVNGITIQIYACLIAYLLLQLLEIPKKA